MHDKSVTYRQQEIVRKSRFQTNVNNLWSGNETMCAHAYTVRKWRPSKRAAAAVCCEWHMTWVNFKFRRRYASLDLRAEVHIVSVLKPRRVLEPYGQTAGNSLGVTRLDGTGFKALRCRIG